MLIDFIGELFTNVGVTMGKSYNSRKGYYSRKVCRRWDFLVYENYRRGKQNRKRNMIRLDGILYKHKRTHSKLKSGYWDSYIIKQEDGQLLLKYKWKQCEKIKGKSWHYNEYVKPAKDSYQNWTWLKGKANIKGWNRSQFCTLIEGKLLYEYYPCQ